MNKALKILTKKKLGVLIVLNKKKKTIGIITDGQIRRFNEKKSEFFIYLSKKNYDKKTNFY